MKESGENYLETIYILTMENGLEPIRSIDLAKKFNYSKPSISRAIKILREKGYIQELEDSKKILLTEEGTKKAKEILEKHEQLVQFLLKLGVSKATAEGDACKIEHCLSAETFQALKRFNARGN